MSIKQVIQSHGFKIALLVCGEIVLLLVIFQFGIFVGFKEAAFSNKIGERYFNEMVGGRENSMMGAESSDFTGPHGAIGKVVAINLPEITVEDHSGIDKIIRISSSTEVKGLSGSDVAANNLQLNDMVVVFGSNTDQNDPIIDANLVHIMPPPDAAGGSVGSTTFNQN